MSENKKETEKEQEEQELIACVYVSDGMWYPVNSELGRLYRRGQTPRYMTRAEMEATQQ